MPGFVSWVLGIVFWVLGNVFGVSGFVFWVSGFVHPDQRCGYSDSLFARKDTFLYCRVQKWVGGVDSGVQIDENEHNSTNMHLKNQFHAGNSTSGRREAFGTSPEPQNGPKTYKKYKNASFGP